MSIHYHSVQDSRIPVVSGVIRADSPHSMWRFRSVPACSEGTPPKQGQAAPTKKNASRNWLQRKLDGIRTQSKPLDVEISVKFARNETSNSIPTKQQLLVRGATKSAEVPKQSSFSALFSQLLRRGRNQAPAVSEKVRPSGRIYTGGHQTADHQSRDSITTSTSGVTGAVSTQASMKSTKPHGGLAHLGCTDAQTLRKLSEHLPDLQTEHTGENRLRQHKNRDSKTIVEFESFVNSKGSIPAWFINHMQR